MGGRGGSSAVSRERMLSDFNALMREQGRLGPEQQIQQALKSLPQGPGGWVGLADLRERLNSSDLTRSQIDAAIMGLVDNRIATVAPVANRKSLTHRDYAAAMRFGEDLVHMIRIRGTT